MIRMKLGSKILLGVWCIVTLAIVTSIFVLGDVIDLLEDTCNQYDMNYEYREGPNCLDKQNVLHPISYECGKFSWSECKIRFIKT